MKILHLILIKKKWNYLLFNDCKPNFSHGSVCQIFGSNEIYDPLITKQGLDRDLGCSYRWLIGVFLRNQETRKLILKEKKHRFGPYRKLGKGELPLGKCIINEE